MLLESLGFGVAVAFILLGIVGTIIPIIPGTLLIWLTVVVYAWVTDFAAISIPLIVFFTLVALVTGTVDLWLPLFGAKRTGASPKAILLGVVGGIIGTFMLPLLGTIIGYAVGILLGEYLIQRDMNAALRASIGSLAGWGIATAIQLGGGILLLVIFVVSVLSA